MIDPTGNALIARIKELEEALRPFAELGVNNTDDVGDGISCYAVVTYAEIQAAEKALNK